LTHCEFEPKRSCKRVGGDDNVHALVLLPDGGVVAGGGRELSFVTPRGRVHEKLDKKRDWPFGAVWSLALAPDGTLFVGGTSGLYWAPLASFTAPAAGRPRLFARAAMVTGELDDDWVTAIAVRGDKLHVGTYNAGVVSFDRDDGRLLDPQRSAALGYVNPAGIQLLGTNTLAVATMEGLRVGGHGGWHRLPTQSRDVTCVLPASFPGGGYVVATRTGLELWQP
jgi:hypothetical protein